MPTRRAWRLLVGAGLTSGAVLAAVVVVRQADPRYDDAREAARVLAQVDAEAPLASDVALPVAAHAQALTKSHVRVELGKEHLRIGGQDVVDSPRDGATSFDPWKRHRYASTAILPSARWARDVLLDAGVESRTVELAIDRDARFGLVLECMASLVEADLAPTLLLVRREGGALGVLRPASGVVPGRATPTLRLDAGGDRAEMRSEAVATPCTWTRGSPAAQLAKCLDLELPDRRDPRGRLVSLVASPDAKYGDVVALIDALAEAQVPFVFTVPAAE